MTYQLVGPSTPLPEIEIGGYELPTSHFSFSQFRLYRQCGLCYFERYVNRQPMALGSALVTGSAVHAALALGRQGLLETPGLGDGNPHDPLNIRYIADAAAEAFDDAIKGIDREGNEPAVPPILKLGDRDGDWGKVRDKAIALAKFTVPQVLAAESKFKMLAVEAQVDMRGVFPFPFAAYADRMLDDPTWATFGQIGDDKTTGDGKNPPDSWAALQLCTYAMPFWLAGEPVSVGVNLHVKTVTPKLRLWNEPGMSFIPTDEQMETTRSLILRAAAGISAGDFPPGPGGRFPCDFPHPAYPSFSIVVPELVAS